MFLTVLEAVTVSISRGSKPQTWGPQYLKEQSSYDFKLDLRILQQPDYVLKSTPHVNSDKLILL